MATPGLWAGLLETHGLIYGCSRKLILFTASGTHLAQYPVSTGGSFPGHGEGRVWQWPFTSIQNDWSCISVPPYAFMAWL